MMKHKNHLDGLAKIVDPTIKHELDYATVKQSYCDMEQAVIRVDGSLILENDDKLDVVAGLAIHEKLHLVHSKPLMKHIKRKRHPISREHGDWGFDLYKSVCNLIEDEYIEKQLPKTCPGYVSYISAVKDHYWKKKSEEMQECDEPFGDLMQTIMLFVRYPSSLQAPQKRRWNNDLRIVGDILKKDGLDREGRLTAMDKLWKHLIQRAKQLGYDEETSFESMYGEHIGDKTDEYEKDFRKKYGERLSEEEIKEYIDRFRASLEDEKRGEYSTSKSPIHRAMEAIGEKVRKIIAELTGEAEKGTISEDLAKKIKELIEEDYSEYEMDSCDAIRGQKKITWQKVSPDQSERNIYTNERKEMRGIIGKLKRKIQLYGNPMKLSIFNQKRGKLNKRVLHRIPAGRDDVFKITTVNEDKQLDVCLLVDESGSMSGNEITLARQSCIAVKEALQDNGKLNLWVFGHTADQNQRLATEMYEYASPTMQDGPLACGAMRARYENRDGNAIYASAERVRQQSDHPSAQKLMIIFSDGAPSADGYRGSLATKHTRRMVQKVESMGFSVIQVGFGGYASSWQHKMFTHAIAVGDIDQMPKQIGKILMKVMKL